MRITAGGSDTKRAALEWTTLSVLMLVLVARLALRGSRRELADPQLRLSAERIGFIISHRLPDLQGFVLLAGCGEGSGRVRLVLAFVGLRYGSVCCSQILGAGLSDLAALLQTCRANRMNRSL